MSSSRPRTAIVVWVTALLLAVLHQDVWLWSDRTLLAGFLPSGLAYHAGFSLAAAALWYSALRFAWPAHIEQWADESHEHDDDAAGTAS